MSSVFIIVEKQTGRPGHGTPGEGYLTIAHTGSYGTYGEVKYPAFDERDLAEDYISELDCWNKSDLEIQEIPLLSRT